jgi:outer membrane lipoprotein-sorting protein
MGSGKLTDGYKILATSEVAGGGTRYELKPKGKDEPVTKLFLEATKETGLIRFLSFEDGLGNITEVKVTDTKFDVDLKESVFEFVPPKDAVVTQVD